MKEVLLVSIGSFFGGGMRYCIAKAIQSSAAIAFPFGTMAVNVLGCLVIGFLSGLNWNGHSLMSSSTKLLLTTGFCGGFTTFSTFMNEGSTLLKDGQYLYMMLYVFGSIACRTLSGQMGCLTGKKPFLNWLLVSTAHCQIHTSH